MKTTIQVEVIKFTTLAQIEKAVEHCGISKNGKKMYTVMFKKAAAEFMLANPNVKRPLISDATGIAGGSLSTWISKLEGGFYTMKGAYATSKHALKSNSAMMAGLNKKKMHIEAQIRLVQQCEDMGITIANVD